jgi:hypothetical protein
MSNGELVIPKTDWTKKRRFRVTESKMTHIKQPFLAHKGILECKKGKQTRKTQSSPTIESFLRSKAPAQRVAKRQKASSQRRGYAKSYPLHEILPHRTKCRWKPRKRKGDPRREAKASTAKPSEKAEWCLKSRKPSAYGKRLRPTKSTKCNHLAPRDKLRSCESNKTSDGFTLAQSKKEIPK